MSGSVLFRATTPDHLVTITWLTHDCFFRLDLVRDDAGAGTFEVPFGRGSERKRFFGTTSRAPATFDCVLAVHNVREVEIEDDAQVGVYDLNNVSYDSERRAVVIEANIPLQISLSVGELDVRVFTRGEPHTNEGGLSWYAEGVNLRDVLRARPS